MSRPLRIFLSCQQDVRPHPLPAYGFWATYFRGALAEAGHGCLEAPGCDWAEGLEDRGADAHGAWREGTWQRAVDWIRREHARQPIDLFLSYLYPAQVDAGGLAELRSMGIPSANFFCDNVREFREAPREFRGFDLNWVPEAGALGMYRRAGMPFINAPMACWVAPEWRAAPGPETLPPTFVGTRDEQRERLFSRAYKEGLTMDLRGPGWSGEPIPWATPTPARGFWGLLSNQWRFASQHGTRALARKIGGKLFPPRKVTFDFGARAMGPCVNEDYFRVLRECRVCVGVNRVPGLRRPIGRPDSYSRLRDIEAPMVGAAYLTESAPGLEDLYDIGKEIEVYSGPEELAAKVAELERDKPHRGMLRRLGQRRALESHTIARTISAIARRLGIA